MGKRYAPVAIPADQVTALRHTYHVSVRGTEPEDRTVERLLRSPVTVAADGVLLLVGVPCWPWEQTAGRVLALSQPPVPCMGRAPG